MLEIKNLSVRYGSRSVLNDVSLTLQPGEFTYLVGINGAGKTSLMNAVMQLIHGVHGEVLIDDQPLTYDDFDRITYIPDQICVDHSLTIRQALDQLSRYYRSYNATRAQEIVEFFHLNFDDSIKDLSKGNIAKVNLLLGLALDTEYILMDEPFSGIDVFTREHIQDLFTSDLLEGRALLISSHDLADVENFVDRVILLKDGGISRDIYVENLRETQGQSILDLMREVYL